MIGGLFKRMEQGLLQSVGFSGSNTMDEEEARLARLEKAGRSMDTQLTTYLSMQMRMSQLALEVVGSLESACTIAPVTNDSKTPNLSPLKRVVSAHASTSLQASKHLLTESLGSLRRFLSEISSVRNDLLIKREKLAEHESNIKRLAQANSQLSTMGSSPDIVENVQRCRARERASAKALETLRDRIDDRLSFLEANLAGLAQEFVGIFVASECHLARHYSNAVEVLLPSYPQSTSHLVTLADGVTKFAILNTTPLSGRPAAAPDPKTDSLATALRRPISVLGAWGAPSSIARSSEGAIIDSAPFAMLHDAVKTNADNVAWNTNPVGGNLAVRPASAQYGTHAASTAQPFTMSQEYNDSMTGMPPNVSQQIKASESRLTGASSVPSQNPFPASTNLDGWGNMDPFSNAPVSQSQTTSLASSFDSIPSFDPIGTTIASSSSTTVLSTKVIARSMYSYTKTQPDELSFPSGIHIEVLSQCTEEGGTDWWKGSALEGPTKGQIGIFPANRVKIAKDIPSNISVSSTGPSGPTDPFSLSSNVAFPSGF